MNWLIGVFGIAALVITAGTAHGEPPVYQLDISEHRFHPPLLQVPANTRLHIHIRNLDQSPEEFESSDLQREKVVPGGGEIETWIGPLDPGTYRFFGDFNSTTAQGRIVAR